MASDGKSHAVCGVDYGWLVDGYGRCNGRAPHRPQALAAPPLLGVLGSVCEVTAQRLGRRGRGRHPRSCAVWSWICCVFISFSNKFNLRSNQPKRIWHTVNSILKGDRESVDGIPKPMWIENAKWKTISGVHWRNQRSKLGSLPDNFFSAAASSCVFAGPRVALIVLLFPYLLWSSTGIRLGFWLHDFNIF